MSLLDGLLNQVSDNATVQNLAAKVGLTPEQVEQAVAALGQAHGAEGDTVTTAAQQTGLSQEALQQIVGHIGGEGALGRFASLLQQDGEGGNILGGLKNLF
jgi:ATP phosphoribosyltransferase regulatory subunit HisZ